MPHQPQRGYVTPAGEIHDFRRVTAEIAGMGLASEIDHLPGVVIEFIEKNGGEFACGAKAVMGHNRFLQRRIAEERAAAEIASLAAPAAEIVEMPPVRGDY